MSLTEKRTLETGDAELDYWLTAKSGRTYNVFIQSELPCKGKKFYTYKFRVGLYRGDGVLFYIGGGSCKKLKEAMRMARRSAEMHEQNRLVVEAKRAARK